MKSKDTANIITEDDLHFFNEGTHFRLWDKLGARPMQVDGKDGTFFAVWAPNAQAVSVVGDFNGWSNTQSPLQPKGDSGIWEGFLRGVGKGSVYKYHIESRHHGFRVDKADPFGYLSETPPKTASVVWDLDYDWSDRDWIAQRGARQKHDRPLSIYEMHLGSWQVHHDRENRSLSYRELAPRLADYLSKSGFTHVEFLPVMEHPFYGSWGYQITGFFAPTSRYGTPQDFMYLVDYLHQRDIGVILDWVPSHFPNDEHGLAYFDGTHLFEHADPRKGFHPDWKSAIFNYGRNEIRSFLISNALFWLDRYHIDGLRVDAVASMLYLDYSRKEGEWIPNEYGGRENLEAIGFLRRLNEEVYEKFPDTQVYAEESTAWPGVSRPTYIGGLGFGFKWDMGWMHDSLQYMQHDPIHRRYHHGELTFRMVYAYTENFVLPLSHDEVVHGKGSLLGKMPGDEWQRFANLRALYGYMYSQPGKKLLFMGAEIAQGSEWSHERGLEWHLLEYPLHHGMQRLVADLNRRYQSHPALYDQDTNPEGYQWIDGSDSENSVLSYMRKSRDGERIAVVCNFTPEVRFNYRVGVPFRGYWEEILNTDASDYGGSGQGNLGGLETRPIAFHGFPQSLNLTLPPLGVIYLRHAGKGA